jgi:hypothetical protein
MQLWFERRIRGETDMYIPGDTITLSNSHGIDNDVSILAAFLMTIDPSNNSFWSSPVTASRQGNYTHQITIGCRICDRASFHIKFAADGSKSTIYVRSVCGHVNWMSPEAPMTANHRTRYILDCRVACELFSQKQTVPIPMSLRKILRCILTCPQINPQNRLFCQLPTYNSKTEKRQADKTDHTCNLMEFFSCLRGAKVVYVTSGFPEHVYRYGDSALVAAVWVAPWAINVITTLVRAKYLQLDGSFMVLKPFTYVIWQAILNNIALPVGFSMGPTESRHVFEIFRDALIHECHLPSDAIDSLPILSDEGGGVKAYANAHHNPHFYCYCHILRKLGAGKPACLIARRALFCSTKEEFKEESRQLAADLLALRQSELITQELFLSLCEFLALKTDGVAIDVPADPDKFEHGIWNRAPYGVSTCDNHAERFHRTLNSACDTRKPLPRRLHLLCSVIYEKFATYGRDPHRQAIKHFQRLKATSSAKASACGRRCGWSEIFQARYGVNGFPCPHVHIDEDMSLEFDELPTIDPPPVSAFSTVIQKVHVCNFLAG